MSRIPARFVASILTFVLGVALAWGLNAHRESALEAKNNIIGLSEPPKATATAHAILDNLTEDERKELYGYGADGIKCRVSFLRTAWVPRGTVILNVEFENTTDKDIVIPSVFEIEILSKDVVRRDYARSRQLYVSDGLFLIQNGEPIYMISRHYDTDRRESRKSIVLHAGETKRIESNISHFAWSDFLSSTFSGDDHFTDIVPPGEYEFLMRITTPKWIIVSNRVDIRVE